MEQVTAFKATDGALFKTADQCHEYEVSLIWRDRIKEFIDSGLSPYTSSQHSSMINRIIVSWENFKTGKASAE